MAGSRGIPIGRQGYTMKGRFPDFKGMAKVVAEHGKRTGDVLVIMPFHNKFDYLDAHLELLKKQTFRKFDLIIVGSSGSDEKRIESAIREKNPDFPVLVAKRFEDNGAAGGFYTGERFALENGYDCMVLAEEDALPIDAHVIEKLVAVRRKGTGFAAPVCSFVIGDAVVFKDSGGHMYTLIGRETLIKTGLHYVPIYLGAEDADLMARLPKPVIVGASVTHPAWLSVFANFERNVGYRVNKTIFTCRSEIPNYLYTFGAMLPAHIVFGVGLTRSAALHVLSCVLRMRYGKDAVFGKGKMIMEKARTFERTVAPTELPGCLSPKLILGERGIRGKLIRYLGFIFRKNVIFYPIKNYELLLGMVSAREAWIATPAGHYLLAENRNLALHALKILSFAVLSPIMLAFGAAVWPAVALRKPRTG